MSRTVQTVKTVAGRNIHFLFYVLYYFFARHLPISYQPYAFGMGKVRSWIASRMFRKCGKNVNIEHGADIGTGKHIEIGHNSGIGVHCIVKRAIIGSNVMMGRDVLFIGQNHNSEKPDEPIQKQGYIEYPPIIIGDNVWIGSRVIILAGRKVGKNAILGAGAVITKDVPEFAIVGGNPATIIRYRKQSPASEVQSE